MSVDEVKTIASKQTDRVRVKIRIAREAAGLTQVQLARITGIDVYGINRLENGTRLVKLVEVYAICVALGLNAMDFIGSRE